MELVCSKCNRVLQYQGDCPSFCAYCGQSLKETALDLTDRYDPMNSTQPPEATVETPILSTPTTLGGYHLMRLLGSGGMGRVFEAEETATGRRVAVKLLATEYTASPEAVERFRQEGRLTSMVGHPRCVFVHTVDETAGQPYIVMELMPGSTLKDLVEQQGRMDPEPAILKILDVIEGLQEAHRLEVIHRDVKPSNCFLEPDGRVKVGDFGLAKSLASNAHLTKTGAFLGTPHFASPEQVRSDSIDAQTDVYSVAATLYYLIIGRPPFGGADSAATLARIVSDKAPSLRIDRPDIPVGLDRIVLRGLERDRKLRWHDLEEFRQALLPFVPGRLAPGGRGLRFAAYLIDMLILELLHQLLQYSTAFHIDSSDELAALRFGAYVSLATQVVWFIYFVVLEGIWGCSLGKRLLRLRVCDVSGSESPGIGRTCLRTLVFLALINLGEVLHDAALLYLTRGSTSTGEWEQRWGLAMMLPSLSLVIGSLLMMSTMRARNGYRGLHEFASQSRVLQLPWPKKRRQLLSTSGWLLYFIRNRRLGSGLPSTSSLPERVGGFSIRGALKWTTSEKILVGEDASLARKVLIWLRPQAEPKVESTRREIGRRTRLRWLACGQHRELQWDAFLAPSGCPLTELIASEGSLPWYDVRQILEELSAELAQSIAEGSLPRTVSLDQVWIQIHGGIQLADMSLAEPSSSTGQADETRALGLLRQVAELALEGKLRSANERPTPLRAPVPAHARPILDRLVGAATPLFAGVQELHRELVATQHQPAEINNLLRAGHLAMLVTFLSPCLIILFQFAFLTQEFVLEHEDNVILNRSDYKRVCAATIAWTCFWPLLWVASAFLFHGGLSFKLIGMSVVRTDGMPASRWRCGWRSFVVWSPVVGLIACILLAPLWLEVHFTSALFNSQWKVCAIAALGLLVFYLALALIFSPHRMIHDYVAGTSLVPK